MRPRSAIAKAETAIAKVKTAIGKAKTATTKVAVGGNPQNQIA